MIIAPRSRTFYEQTGIYGSRAWEARETLLNGLEVKLPNDVFFRDYYGVKRYRVRLNWWQSQQTTFREAAVIDDSQRTTIPDFPAEENHQPMTALYASLVTTG